MTPFRPRWLGSTVIATSPIPELQGLAAHAEDLRAVSQLTPWRRRESLAARVLLRGLIRAAVDPDTAESPLSALPSGRPYLTARPDIGVSLSHTDGWVAAAVCPGDSVGIDIQAPLPVSDRLVRRCCTPSARRLLESLPDWLREREFARIWTIQEACVKAAGTGFAGRPWRIPVEAGQQQGCWRSVRWACLPEASPVLASCAEGPGRCPG